MKKTNVVKLALGVGVCAILASVVMLGACGGAEMTDNDAATLFKAIRNTEEYEGSYTFTDTYTDEESMSYEYDDSSYAYASVETETVSAGYNSSSKNYWKETSSKSVDSDDGTYEDDDIAIYRVVGSNSTKIYRSEKDRLEEYYSYKEYRTYDSVDDYYISTSLYNNLPYYMRYYAIYTDEDDVTLDDFVNLVYGCTDLSYNADPDYYTCTVSTSSSKTTYTFSLNYKYSFNENGIKETKQYKVTTVFTVEDNKLTGYKTSGTVTYSLGEYTNVDFSESYDEEMTISYDYTDKIPTDFSDYTNLDAED